MTTGWVYSCIWSVWDPMLADTYTLEAAGSSCLSRHHHEASVAWQKQVSGTIYTLTFHLHGNISGGTQSTDFLFFLFSGSPSAECFFLHLVLLFWNQTWGARESDVIIKFSNRTVDVWLCYNLNYYILPGEYWLCQFNPNIFHWIELTSVFQMRPFLQHQSLYAYKVGQL